MKNKIKDFFIKPKPKYLYYFFFFIPIVLFLVTGFELDNDFYFLYSTGKYIIEHGFPNTLIFTIHKDFSFIAQQWLSTIIFYFVYHSFGITGMKIFMFIIFLLILYLAYKLCYIVSERRSVSVLFSCIISILLNLNFIRTRPQIFDYVIFLLEFIILESYFKDENKKHLFFMPILSFFLINLHASSFFLFFIFILPYFINTFNFKFCGIESKKRKRLPLIFSTIISFLVGFINPYGLDSITYIFNSYGIDSLNLLITEMHAPVISSSFGFLVYLCIFLVLFIYFIFKNKEIEARYFFLYVGTSILAISKKKAFPFFILGSIFPLAYYLKDIFPKDKEFNLDREVKIDYLVAASILIFMLIFNFTYSYKNTTKVYINKICNIILNDEKKNDVKYRVYTGYNNGSYAEYKGLKVYIDPRAEAYLKSINKEENIINEYVKMEYYPGFNYEKFLNKYNFDYLIVDESDPLYKYYLKKNKLYKRVYKEKVKDASNTHINYLYKKI